LALIKSSTVMTSPDVVRTTVLNPDANATAAVRYAASAVHIGETMPSDPMSSNWPAIRVRVRRRSGGRCEHIDPATGTRCPDRRPRFDHVTRATAVDRISFANLADLCQEHRAHTTTADPGGRPGLPRHPQQRGPPASCLASRDQDVWKASRSRTRLPVRRMALP
jgi:hypothetical protein